KTQAEINNYMNQELSGSELNLVAYYRFNEGGGDTLFDNSINNHHGVLRGSPGWVDGHTLSGLIGDVNFDETINIYDAVMLVSIMLNYETGTPLQVYACDINQDNIIDILDIIQLIQIVMDLDTANRQILTNASFFTYDNYIKFESDGPVLGFEIILSDSYLIEDNQLPSSWSWNQKGNKIIAFSLDGSSLPDNFKIPISEKLDIEKITLAGWGNETIDAIKSIFPKTFELKTGPNPFNPKCKILFTIYSHSKIELKIFDLTGHLVENIFSGNIIAGDHSLNWAPKNISSGTYFIQITDGALTQTSKVIYLK
ncbi:MAG: T9SS type A sorting domain-containing protein, partial [Candidatus Marinimicrobia bacterium]|nr:T9SS type A sorting domain-containing protein [Candidatus Neomarinimicrobiota bacterium]